MIRYSDQKPAAPALPAKVKAKPGPKSGNATFDKTAYQREYMRKRRAAEKAAKEPK